MNAGTAIALVLAAGGDDADEHRLPPRSTTLRPRYLRCRFAGRLHSVQALLFRPQLAPRIRAGERRLPPLRRRAGAGARSHSFRASAAGGIGVLAFVSARMSGRHLRRAELDRRDRPCSACSRSASRSPAGPARAQAARRARDPRSGSARRRRRARRAAARAAIPARVERPMARRRPLLLDRRHLGEGRHPGRRPGPPSRSRVILGYSLGTSLPAARLPERGALTVAGIATLLTNALPIAAGTIVLGEPVPSGAFGVLRVLAFGAVTAGAFLLVRRGKLWSGEHSAKWGLRARDGVARVPRARCQAGRDRAGPRPRRLVAPRAANDDGRRQPRRRLPARALARGRAGRRACRTSRASTATSSAPDGYTMPATQHDAVLWLSGSAYDVIFDVARAAIAALDGARDGRRGDVELAVPPRPRPHRLHRRHREPDADRRARARGDPRRRARRGRHDPAPAEVGARRDGVGVAAGRRAGAGDRPHEGRQRRARRQARRLARRAHRPGHASARSSAATCRTEP